LYILGIAPGHNSTAVLLKDGEIRYAIAEERLSRFKGDMRFPRLAINKILELEGISLHEIDYFTIHTNDIFAIDIYDQRFFWDDKPRAESVLYKIEMHQIPSYLIYQIPILGSLYRHKSTIVGKKLFFENIKRFGIDPNRLYFYDHHLSHAASAFFTSEVDPSLIVTLDASGDGLSGTVSIGSKGRINRIASVLVQEGSAGAFYTTITRYLGFIPNRHEGKVLGLAAYGNPDKYYELLKPLLIYDRFKRTLSRNINISNNQRIVRKIKTIVNIIKGYKYDSYTFYIDVNKEDFRKASREDLAAAAQKRLEDVVVEYVGEFVKETGIKDVLLAGGVFSNVKLNQRLFENLSLNSIYIHPDMTDGGGALGSAFLKWSEINGPSNHHRKTIETVYWGPSFTNTEVESVIKKNNLKAVFVDEIEKVAAESIAQGKIIGYFGLGGMEYGPRALGNRSILASPVDNEINIWLNKRLNRTEFMPFAPVVLEEHASKILKNYTSGNKHPAKFMTITFDVTDFCKEKAPAVVHIDGTARPQTINYQQNPSYYKILKYYYEKTGIPCIINTSFNVHEEPIVYSPDDAIKSFKEGRIDILIMGNWLITSQDG